MLVIIGSRGSMGRRYQAILKLLGKPYVGFDLEDGEPWTAAAHSDGIILATPTHTHGSLIAQRRGVQGIPFLCEKPLATDLRVVEHMLSIPNPLQMMAQYRFLDPPTDGPTIYNYYHSGLDGLGWDCLTLLGLARGPVELRQTSPVWRCSLNGRILTIEEVQESYITAVEDWLEHPEGDRAWMRQAHERAARWVSETPSVTICSQLIGATIPRSPGACQSSRPDAGDR